MNINTYLMIKSGVMGLTDEETDARADAAINKTEASLQDVNAGKKPDPVTKEMYSPINPNQQPINVTKITPEDKTDLTDFSTANQQYNHEQAEKNVVKEQIHNTEKKKIDNQHARYNNRRALAHYLLLSSLGAALGAGGGMIGNIGSKSWKQYGSRTGLSALMGAGLGAGAAYLSDKLIPQAVWDKLGINRLYEFIESPPAQKQIEAYNPEAYENRPENMQQ